jgi:phage shock protein PspC (stress-responsive transcriptional regulator)
MRTVITISLNGNAYQLDAVGYDALRAYLQVAEQRLAGNPDREEILADLEQAIADKCNRYLGPHKNVVSAAEVAEVIREMGPVDGGAGEGAAQGGAARDAGAGAGRAYTADEYAEAVGESWNAGGGGSGAGGGASAGGASGGGAGPGGAGLGGAAGTMGAAPGQSSRPGYTGAPGSPGDAPRRLYQIREGSFISGVCNGLAAYLNIDVSVVRILFVVLAIVTGGVWILVYIAMMFVIPYAETSEQHAAAHGWPFNAEELIGRAKAHYAAFKDGGQWRRQQRREEQRMWKNQRKQWKEERRAWERAGGLRGAPPPPPPWSGAPPANMTYSSQVLSGVLTPLVELVGALLFVAFLLALVSLVTHHRIFGWSLPGDVPGWVGIVILIVLYRVIVSPLRQARYAAHYGPSFGQGWLALWGVLLWLATLSFFVWLAWQHWPEVQGFFQQLASSLRDLIEHRPAAPADPVQAAIFLLPAVPPCLLHVRACAGELETHGQIHRTNVLGDAAD